MSAELGRRVSADDDIRQLPPEMVVLRAKSEQRRRELDALKEALANASPEKRAKLLEQWRTKRLEEMNRQFAEMPQ